MSRLTRALNRLAAFRWLVERAREEMPQLTPLLEALESDGYEEAWLVFSSYGEVQDILATVPEGARVAMAEAGPYLMRALDALVDERAILGFLERIGLKEPSA